MVLASVHAEAGSVTQRLSGRKRHTPGLTLLHGRGVGAHLAGRAVTRLHVAVLVDGALRTVLTQVVTRLRAFAPQPTAPIRGACCMHMWVTPA